MPFAKKVAPQTASTASPVLPDFVQALPLAQFYDHALLEAELASVIAATPPAPEEPLLTVIDRDNPSPYWRQQSIQDAYKTHIHLVKIARHPLEALSLFISAKQAHEQALANDAATVKKRALLVADLAELEAGKPAIESDLQSANVEWRSALAANRDPSAVLADEVTPRASIRKLEDSLARQIALLEITQEALEALPKQSASDAGYKARLAELTFEEVCRWCNDYSLAAHIAKRAEAEGRHFFVSDWAKTAQVGRLVSRLTDDKKKPVASDDGLSKADSKTDGKASDLDPKA